MKELIKIQAGLKAPKDKYSSFGRFSYRSCEDILEAVKPHLKDTGCTLIINDEIMHVGDRYYIKSTVTLRNSAGESVTATALAREEDKKGMDAAQATGAASSYARKYALNGMFAIDDTKDPDSDEHYKRTHPTEQTNTAQPKQAQPKPAQARQRKVITLDILENDTQRISLYEWCYKKFVELGCPNDFDSVIQLRQGYDLDNDTAEVFRNGYATFHTQKLTPRA